MRTVLFMLTLLLMLTLTLLPSLAAAAPKPPVTMTAFLDRSTYRSGRPIVLEVDLHNTQTQKVAVHNGAYQDHWFRFTLLDAAGRIVPRTARGKEMLRPPHEFYVNPPVIFGPKATRRYRFNLAALFQVSPAKSYTLRVSSTLDFLPASVSPLTAGPFKFRIAKAAASRHAPKAKFVYDPSADLNFP